MSAHFAARAALLSAFSSAQASFVSFKKWMPNANAKYSFANSNKPSPYFGAHLFCSLSTNALTAIAVSLWLEDETSKLTVWFQFESSSGFNL